MTASNPFGESQGDTPFQPGAPIAPSLNPYAPPASAAEFQPTTSPTGERLGLPWESEPRGVRCWFRTMALVLGSPSRAFAMMKRQGGLWTPIHFNIYPLAAMVWLAGAIVLPLMIISGLRNADTQGYAIVGGFIVGGLLAGIVIMSLYVLFIASVWQLVVAACFHLSLLLVGGGKQGYETTFRVTSYAYYSLVLLGAIPYIGGMVMMVWLPVLLIIGFSKAHEISTMRAAAAVLLPLGLCIALCAGFVVFNMPSVPQSIPAPAE